jgi:hypothetical protein
MTVPEGVAQVIGSATQHYQVAPGGERWIDWEARFNPEFLKTTPVPRSTYNNAGTFGVFVSRGNKAPGRRPARHHMELGFWLETGAALPGLAAVDAYLASTKPFPLRQRGDDAPAGEIRWALAGNELAVCAKIKDTRPARREPLWDSTCVEIFGCMAGRSPSNTEIPGGHFPVRQVYLLPAIGDKPAIVLHRAKDKLTEIKDLKYESKAIAGGYEVRALIPLSLLTLDFDTIQRLHYSYSGYAPKSLLGILPATGDARLEARVNRLSPTGATEKATVFGSPAPHVDNHAFGFFRLRPPVKTTAEILAPVPYAGQGEGQVKVTLQNRSQRPVSDHLKWLLFPTTVASLTGENEFDLKLAPGETKEFTLSLPAAPKASLLSQVELQLARSPANTVVAQVLTNVPVAARPLMTLTDGQGTLAGVKEHVRGAQVLPLVFGTQSAMLYLGLYKDQLAIYAIIPDSQVNPNENQPWKGSCLELYGSPAIGGSIGQILLTPNPKGAGAVLRRPVDKAFPVEETVPMAGEATPEGYAIWGLIPLSLLGLAPDAPELLLEAQLTSFNKEGKLVRGTLFGSPRAYQGSHHYGAFRRAKPGTNEGMQWNRGSY